MSINSSSEVIREYVSVNGEFVFYSNGREIAKECRDGEGNIKLEGEIPDGIVKTYYKDDKGSASHMLFAEWNYKDGKLEGISKIYLENGQVEEELSYNNGK
ncbi:MAG: hypothetical protein V1752_00085, partial [Candidatus Firestonebacteria bacterium]